MPGGRPSNALHPIADDGEDEEVDVAVGTETSVDTSFEARGAAGNVVGPGVEGGAVPSPPRATESEDPEGAGDAAGRVTSASALGPAPATTGTTEAPAPCGSGDDVAILGDAMRRLHVGAVSPIAESDAEGASPAAAERICERRVEGTGALSDGEAEGDDGSSSDDALGQLIALCEQEVRKGGGRDGHGLLGGMVGCAFAGLHRPPHAQAGEVGWTRPRRLRAGAQPAWRCTAR